ncbi:hypothetical protein Hanom_Chr03g00247581 [Helianthus anomalus]
MSFDLGEDFVFDQELARALIEHKSPIRPLHERFLLLGRVCFRWSQGDRDWPVIRRKRDRAIMSLRDALKVPSFDVLDFDLEEQGEDDVPLMKQVSSSAQEVRPLIAQDAVEPSTTEGASSAPIITKEAAGSSGSRADERSILNNVDDDPEIRELDEALQYRPSSASLKSKGVVSEPESKPLSKKNKKGSSHSEGDVMNEFDEHLTGGKFSREEASLARSKPTPAYSGGFIPDNEVESMEVENLEGTDKEKAHGGPKVVTFSGTFLDLSLGPGCFLDDEEDQVTSLPSSWFGPELMSFFRYADTFSDEMEIDPRRPMRSSFRIGISGIRIR